MKIIMITSEAAPFSRTGILGDAVSGLSKGLAMNGAELTVISPMYLCVSADACQAGDVTVTVNGVQVCFDIFQTERSGVQYIFFRNEELFGRRHIYGSGDFDYSDNDIRFGMFCMAALEYMRIQSLKPDIIHCHEWATGLVPVYRNLFYEDIKAKIVFTAHDISYQGVFNKFSVKSLGLPWSVYNIEELEYYEGISLLKGGMVHADHVTVPSETYAQDIQTEEYSQGLGLFVADISHKLTGLFGGIDYEEYNPESDRFLAATYTADSTEQKGINKAAFLKEAGLSGAEKPLFMVETKFSERKGLELIAQSADELAQIDANFAFFGYGESHLCSKFKEIAKKHDNMYTSIGVNERMVHLGYGGADFMMRPSQYEPSGNSNLKGMRYGALPIVSRTGGHIDSVTPLAECGCGFFIDDYCRQALQDAINRAVAFYADKTILTECMRRVMGLDFSWKSASLKYIEIYRRLLGGSYEP